MDLTKRCVPFGASCIAGDAGGHPDSLPAVMAASAKRLPFTAIGPLSRQLSTLIMLIPAAASLATGNALANTKHAADSRR